MNDERTHRVYEGVVTAAMNVVGKDNGQLDIDHGIQTGPFPGSKSHVWTDSSCWLKDLVGRRVKLTVEVLDSEQTEST